MVVVQSQPLQVQLLRVVHKFDFLLFKRVEYQIDVFLRSRWSEMGSFTFLNSA